MDTAKSLAVITDYELTFAPVAHVGSIRTLLALAAGRGLHLRHFDIKTAFLYGVLPSHQRVYLQPPQGVEVPAGHVLELYRNMYGLKQASLQWNKHLDATLSKIGGRQFFLQQGERGRTTPKGRRRHRRVQQRAIDARTFVKREVNRYGNQRQRIQHHDIH